MNEAATITAFHSEMRQLELIEWTHYHLEYEGHQWILVWHTPMHASLVTVGAPCFYRYFGV